MEFQKVLLAPSAPLKKEDYGQALVHAAWLVKRDRRILIFGFVELFPSEYPRLDEQPEQCVKSSGCKGWRLFFARIRMSAETALNLYKDTVFGKGLRLPVKGKDKDKQESLLETPRYLVEPEWPNLNLPIEAPYLPKYTQPRCHHLLPQAIEGSEFCNLLACDSDIGWLENRFFFSLADYKELMGSFHLLGHNPVYRDIQGKLYRTKEGNESVRYHIELRQKKTVEGLSLLQIEKRMGEYSGFQIVKIVEPTFIVPLSGVADKVEHMVYCQTRGLLEKTEPCNFIRQTNLTVGVHLQDITVHVPGEKGNIDEIYSSDRISWDRPVVLKKEEVPEAFRLYSENRLKRERSRQAKIFEQKWFENNPTEAREFVRGLIKKARERILIVDPYFSTVELFRFALATTSPAVEVLIVTSANHLLGQQNKITSIQNLYDNLEALKKNYQFTVRVMTGKPLIHDRFLIIDDSVWFVGNSLESLGKRAGMMIKLPDPEPVIAVLTEIIFGDRSKEFGEWMKNRVTT